MDKIPPEICGHIASLLGAQRDVATLCLVSTKWLEAARPVLYKHLQLEYISDTREDTLEMLSENPRVMRSITALKLCSREIEEWLNHADTLRGMLNLQLLHLWGEFSVSSIKCITSIFYEVARSLRKVVLEVNHDDELQSRELVILQSMPHMLRSLCVETSNISIPLLQTTFLHSPSSITMLELFSDIGEYSTMDELLPVIRLPNLEIFKVTRIGIDDAAEPIMLNFLVGHPSIQTLSITLPKGLDLDLALERPRNILPNLTSLSANHAIIEDLSEICPALSNLISLEFFNANMEDDDEGKGRAKSFLSAMKRINQRIGIFPRLRHFEMEYTDSVTTARLFKSMSQAAPSMEHISILDLVPGSQKTYDEKKMSRLFKALDCFTMLQRVDLHSTLYLPPSTIIAKAQNSRTLRAIYVFVYGVEKEETRIEREGEPAHSSIFNTIDMKSSRIW